MADTFLPSGFAIRRNGTCLAVEIDCGKTVNPYHGCCPSGTGCPSQYNIACCQSGHNCTESLVATPHCANSSWTMYNNGGYFCCEPGTHGYAALDTGSDGCLLSLDVLPSDIQLLAIVSQTVISGTSAITSSAIKSFSTLISSSSSTTIPSSSTLISSSSSMAVASFSTLVASSSSTTVASYSTSNTSSISSSTNSPSTGGLQSNPLEAGVIAGIVVGIILSIAILIFAGTLFHRRRKEPLVISSSHLVQEKKLRDAYIHELGGVNPQEMPTPGPISVLDQKPREYTELAAGDIDHRM